MPARVQYQMHVVGRVGPAASEVFADFGVRVEGTATVLSGALDQAALHGLIARVRGLGLEPVTPAGSVGAFGQRCRSAPVQRAHRSRYRLGWGVVGWGIR